MRKFSYLIALVVAGMFGIGVIDFVYAEQRHALSASPSDGSTFKQESGDCVESVPIMRKGHMDFLFHQRDNTLYQGIRTKRYSLKGCVDCHVQQDNQGRVIPINAADQFCQDCHQYVAVNIDCFQCHATIPDADGRNR
uniref:Uncharacterized protein n=1 Tax=Candidatus Kentrum sp. FW TaxID=2126338 RepID=A0A450S2K4_9GAMM|nr:MAG: hypothetical protein BECKFW1821A_GA0114235_101135 [Candidatus Kentron sp. FW]VFJ46691.1 MAG: hypothetical protein BECKFW1821B_GA0114236_100138 [Candidatus Kentron sp. FW]